VNPLVSGLAALFAYVLVGSLDFDLIEMGAFLRHRFLHSLGRALLATSAMKKGAGGLLLILKFSTFIGRSDLGHVC
jgi:hypothetical protein